MMSSYVRIREEASDLECGLSSSLISGCRNQSGLNTQKAVSPGLHRQED